MSRKLQPKEKRVDNLKLFKPEEIFECVGFNGKKPVFKQRKTVVLFGKVSKGTSVYISKPNQKGENDKYVDDFSALNKNTKSKICDLFENKNKRVVYLGTEVVSETVKNKTKKGR